MAPSRHHPHPLPTNNHCPSIHVTFGMKESLYDNHSNGKVYSTNRRDKYISFYLNTTFSFHLIVHFSVFSDRRQKWKAIFFFCSAFFFLQSKNSKFFSPRLFSKNVFFWDFTQRLKVDLGLKYCNRFSCTVSEGRTRIWVTPIN